MTFACSYLRSNVGKKTIVAVTGLIMVGFLFVHMLGNLQMFEGRELDPAMTKMNAYAAFLKKEMALLWGARLFLLASAALHVIFTIKLTIENKKARPEGYAVRKTYSSAASRMMIYGGIFLLFYIVYHILHFTTGSAHPELFHHEDVYQTVVASFQVPMISVVYVAAMVALFAHLYHGTLALFYTLGVTNPSHLCLAKKVGLGLSIIICGGFISIPVGVLLGCIQ